LDEAEQRNSVLEHVPAETLQAPTPEREDEKQSKSRWGRSRKKSEDMGEELTEAELYQSPRPAFSANERGTKRSQIPRDVAVPYFRFRKDRFYDWPPDPTVSRATPLHTVVEKDDALDLQQNEYDTLDADIRSSYSEFRAHKPHHQRKHSLDNDANFGYGY